MGKKKFILACRQATDEQLVEMWREEKKAERKDYALIALDELAARVVIEYKNQFGEVN